MQCDDLKAKLDVALARITLLEDQRSKIVAEIGRVSKGADPDKLRTLERIELALQDPRFASSHPERL